MKHIAALVACVSHGVSGACLFDIILLAQESYQHNTYASAVSGTVQSFSIKDARFIIEYIGYFAGYLPVQVCVCTLQKIRQNLPAFLQYAVVIIRGRETHREYEINCDYAFDYDSNALAVMQELLVQSGSYLCCIIKQLCDL